MAKRAMLAAFLLLATLAPIGVAAQDAAGALAATNAARAAAGRAALIADPALMRAAAAHAAHVARANAMTHRGPQGRRPMARVRAAGLRACYVSENLALGPWSGRQVARAWLDSPAHRRNALSRRATRVGIARRGRAWVMVLARPC